MGVKHLFGGGWKFSTLLTPFLEYRTPLISMNPPQSLLLSLRVLNEVKFWGEWAPTLFILVFLFGGWRWEFSPQAGQGKFLHFEASSWELRRHSGWSWV